MRYNLIEVEVEEVHDENENGWYVDIVSNGIPIKMDERKIDGKWHKTIWVLIPS